MSTRTILPAAVAALLLAAPVLAGGSAGELLSTWKAPINAVRLDAEGDIAVLHSLAQVEAAVG